MTQGLRIALGLALTATFAFAMWRATLEERGVTCEVCIEFEGRTACRSGGGRDRAVALSGAQNVACSALAGGVTRGMQCDRVVPHSIRCSDDSEY